MKWVRIKQLSAWQWGVLLRSPFVLLLIWTRLQTSGYLKTLAKLQSATLSTLQPEQQSALARDTAYAFAVAVKFGPWSPKCLTRSLALAWFLAQKGIAFQLRIGIPEGQSSMTSSGEPDFTAHAWLEHAGFVLNDKEEVAREHIPFDT